MKFEEWMSHRGLSPSSVEKYVGAINGPLSDWAREHQFLQCPLVSITSVSVFNSVSSQIRLLAAFKERNTRGHHMYSSALSKFGEYLAEGFENDIEADIDDLLGDQQINSTERRNLVKSRIGQGIFRQRILAHWKKCAVTGFENTSMLVASHIKPWRLSNNLERLDGFNGLLLTPNLDKAFDSGLISFSEDGQICISPLFPQAEKLGITHSMRVDLSSKHDTYMHFHRASVYRFG